MTGQVLGVVMQYIIIGGGLIALFLLLRSPSGVSKIIDSLANLNTGAINAFKK